VGRTVKSEPSTDCRLNTLKMLK
jgi:Fe-S-cluster containining protein